MIENKKNVIKNFLLQVNKMLLIGGKNERDFKRTLTATFFDDLASMCSQTGQNNFKIGDTYIMLGIKSKFLYIDLYIYILKYLTLICNCFTLYFKKHN